MSPRACHSVTFVFNFFISDVKDIVFSSCSSWEIVQRSGKTIDFGAKLKLVQISISCWCMNVVNLHSYYDANISYSWKGNNVNSSVFYCLNFLLFYHDAKIKGYSVLES